MTERRYVSKYENLVEDSSLTFQSRVREADLSHSERNCRESSVKGL